MYNTKILNICHFLCARTTGCPTTTVNADVIKMYPFGYDNECSGFHIMCWSSWHASLKEGVTIWAHCFKVFNL